MARRSEHVRAGRWRRLSLALAGAGVLAAIFLAYLQPAFIVDLANRIYLCF
ncbi:MULTISPECIES: hypothetical protein [unclassified Herbaspirillum]|uniref:hypothetical protein n=1 Tax=unclassified Herbaspirillum TaxID=2624150 RepID=UPI00160D35C9|nr:MULTISPECIES: hypothetical protein [unclassified Herbaspirillum]MBB5393854.1 hypothetical protein [Herbaspirillum sp. SJZ102]